jgi:hypothetical protein
VVERITRQRFALPPLPIELSAIRISTPLRLIVTTCRY